MVFILYLFHNSTTYSLLTNKSSFINIYICKISFNLSTTLKSSIIIIIFLPLSFYFGTRELLINSLCIFYSSFNLIPYYVFIYLYQYYLYLLTYLYLAFYFFTTIIFLFNYFFFKIFLNLLNFFLFF